MSLMPDPVLRPWPKHSYNDPQKCHFCPTLQISLFIFQGKPICSECNEKLIKRIKLILDFQ